VRGGRDHLQWLPARFPGEYYFAQYGLAGAVVAPRGPS
jgi:hypothetical protein